MKRFYVVAMVLFFTLVSVKLGAGQTKATEPEKPAEQKTTATKTKAVHHHAIGSVVSVDVSKKVLVVKGEDSKELTFMTSPAAEKTLPDFKVGDNVRVSYTEEAGQLTAQKITKKKAAKAEMEKPAPPKQ